MSDDRKNTGPQDDSRVNVNQPHEVQYWTKKFGCTEEQLRRAVQAVGVSATAVGAWISGSSR